MEKNTKPLYPKDLSINKLNITRKSMKTIGVLGGMSWESSVAYYRILNQESSKIGTGLSSAKIFMQSVNFAEINDLMQKRNWNEIAKILSYNAKIIETAGADFLMLATNTMHKLYDEIQKNLSIPILHIADTVGEILVKENITTAGLLGTIFTMQENFYKRRLLEKFGISVIVSTKKMQQEQNRIIFEELCIGKTLARSKEEYLQAIRYFQNKQIQAVILGCTEIGMLISQKDTSILVIDTTQTHCKKAVQVATGKDTL